MKNILFYGDSNTWGNIAGTFDAKLMLHQRYEYGVRWTSLVQKLLGDDFHIIEAGLNGRTTSFDETHIVRPSRNGLATLPGILDMNYPLDLVVLMLGTNDIKTQFHASVERITEGMKQLIQVVKTSHFGPDKKSPEILIISPPPIFKAEGFAFDLFFDSTSIEKSHQLAAHYEKLAQETFCGFLEAGPLVKIDPKDGLHIDQESQGIFAEAVAEKIKEML